MTIEGSCFNFCINLAHVVTTGERRLYPAQIQGMFFVFGATVHWVESKEYIQVKNVFMLVYISGLEPSC